MVWHGPESDPRTDPAASDVMAAYTAAAEAQRTTVACYRAGVEAWRRVHPDHTPEYASKQAVAVILAAKTKVLLRVE